MNKLEQAAKEYADNTTYKDAHSHDEHRCAFIAGAQWQGRATRTHHTGGFEKGFNLGSKRLTTINYKKRYNGS